MPPDLRKRKCFQFCNIGSPGQRLGNALHQGELLRTGKQELSVAGSAGIYRPLEVAEQAGRVLHLIDDYGRQVPLKEASRLFFGLFGFGGKIKGYELMVGEEPSKSGSLTGLASAGQHHHWTGPCRPLQAWLNIARYPHVLSVRYKRIFCTVIRDIDVTRRYEGFV